MTNTETSPLGVGGMKKKIYIAGKVTGEPIVACTMKFGAAHKELEKLGFEVVNPLVVVGDFKTPWDVAMKLCIDQVMKCDAVLLLPCWVNSKGAKLEVEICDALKIPTFNNIDDLKLWNK